MKKMKRIASAIRSRFAKAPARPARTDGAKRLYRYFPRGQNDVPLQFVLDYLREDAGFSIDIKPDTQLDRSLSLPVDQQPTHDEAISMVRQALSPMGCTLVRKGRVLTIISSREAKKNCIPLPVISVLERDETAMIAQ